MDTQFGLKAKTITAIRAVFAAFPQVGKVVVYGSRAKGNYKIGSDIDLTLMPSKSNQLDLSVQLKIEDALEELMLPYQLDISIFDSIENPKLVDHIQRVGQVFYAQVEG